MIDGLSLDYKIVFKYLTRHWDLEFSEVDGYKVLKDVKTVFGFGEGKVKEIITEWFCEFEIVDNWWEHKFPKLNATWTPQMANDLANYHNIDVEAELTGILSNEITQQINWDVMNNIVGISSRYFGSVDPATNKVETSSLRHMEDRIVMDVNVTPMRRVEYIECGITIQPSSLSGITGISIL